MPTLELPTSGCFLGCRRAVGLAWVTAEQDGDDGEGNEPMHVILQRPDTKNVQKAQAIQW